MSLKTGFFLDVMNAIDSSNSTKKNAIELLNTLLYYDPYRLTRFEFSFNVKNGKISKDARFLNIDGKGYSYANSIFFRKRLALFEKMIKEKGFAYDNVISALRGLSDNPMDLYFGFDADNNDILFAFWLVFGGVKKTGDISFCPYDFNSILHKFFDAAKSDMPKILNKEILNFGVDLGKDGLRFKFYYLCRDKVLKNHDFTELMISINKNLNDFKYFYFFSEMYDEDGRLVKKKLFIEFLENIANDNKKRIDGVVKCLSKINNVDFDIPKVKDVLFRCGGRISLISFELDGALTFYIRPD